MLYLGIDQHKSQLTVNIRNEEGETIFKRQVSTRWEKIEAFFADLAEKSQPEGGFLTILEVCGMNPWLIETLRRHGCREIVIIQPTSRGWPRFSESGWLATRGISVQMILWMLMCSMLLY